MEEEPWGHDFVYNGTCANSTVNEYLFQHTKIKSFYATWAGLSITASAFVFITVFSVKKLKAHPSVMIGYIALFEAIS